MDWQEEAERLRQQLEERDTFLAVVAHELRNPMHSLSLQITAARMEAQKQGAGAAAARISKAEGVLQRYVEHANLLLDLARADPRSNNAKPGDIAALLRRAADEAQTRHPAIGLRLSLPQSCQARFDAVAVEYIVNNLLTNACRHAGVTLVEVGLERDDHEVSIAVADDGTTLTDWERVFGKFDRGGAGTSRNNSGLGLWVARLLAEHLGGSLSLQDRPGKGAVLHLRIPVD